MPSRRLALPGFCYRSSLWFFAFVAWFVILWILSSGPLPDKSLPRIPYADKVLHFGYYFGGAGLLSAALYLRDKRPNWDTLFLIVIVVLTATGALDEWHQSWSEFRTGNDAGDLTADFFGAVAGTLVFRRMKGFLDRTSD